MNHNSLNRTLKPILELCATLLIATSTTHAADAMYEVAITRTVTDGFVHPGIGLTKEILENAREQVRSRKEPWYSGFQSLAAHPDSAKNVKCRNESPTRPGLPDIDAFDSKNVEARLAQDSTKAKHQVLMYIFTGEEVYRANAMNIVRVWSHMDAGRYKAYNESHIHPSYPIQNLIIAAELLRYTSTKNVKLAWTDEDTQNFSNNFAYPAVKTFSDGDGWFMNQSGYPLAACIASDIFRNDHESYARHVEWFTVSKSAPNQGWAFSIQALIRKVDTNALTGQKIDRPVIQIVEMGRDQAHGGDDVDIFMNIARQLNAQNTKLDPRDGTISRAPNAVGPYEFLDDRILAGANYFWQYMLGYDTPWVPTPSDMTPDGRINQIYPRLADAYRGRLAAREFVDIWDAYYYYTYERGINLAEKAPFYSEAFHKRIITAFTDWISIPASVTGEAARPARRDVPTDVIEVEQRTTPLSKNVTIVNESDSGFLRIVPSPDGTRLAILGSSTGDKSIALRIRSNGAAEASMAGFAKPWLWPDTHNQWRTVVYQRGELERFLDIIFVSVRGSESTQVEIDQLTRGGADKIVAPAFCTGNESQSFITAVGLPLNLDFAATGSKDRSIAIDSEDKPAISSLDSKTGAFTWTPTESGEISFIVSASDDQSMAAKRVKVTVAPDRGAAVRQITSSFKDQPYVRASSQKWVKALEEVEALDNQTPGEIFMAKLLQLQQAYEALEPLTPLLPDGSLDYPRIATCNIGPLVGLFVDNNDDTFTGSKQTSYIFDFGENFCVSVNAFAMEGRLNFENRAQDMYLLGSNDAHDWKALTDPIAAPPTELTKVEVKSEFAREQFRYLKLQKTERRANAIFEHAELRFYGQRYENHPK